MSSDERDPSLSDGWAFFVKKKEYKEHLKAHWDLPQEVRVQIPLLNTEVELFFVRKARVLITTLSTVRIKR